MSYFINLVRFRHHISSPRLVVPVRFLLIYIFYAPSERATMSAIDSSEAASRPPLVASQLARVCTRAQALRPKPVTVAAIVPSSYHAPSSAGAPVHSLEEGGLKFTRGCGMRCDYMREGAHLKYLARIATCFIIYRRLHA